PVGGGASRRRSEHPGSARRHARGDDGRGAPHHGRRAAGGRGRGGGQPAAPLAHDRGGGRTRRRGALPSSGALHRQRGDDRARRAATAARRNGRRSRAGGRRGPALRVRLDGIVGARREAHEALAAAGLRPRKRWGQHFLCDPAVARRIVDAAALGSESVVLEIGPGLGALTDELAARAARLYLVEIDRVLSARLIERHADRPHVRVLIGDVLALPLESMLEDDDVTVVANLPYNIATPVLFRLLALR